MSMELALHAIKFKRSKGTWLKMASCDSPELDEVLTAVADRKDLPDDIAFDWLEEPESDDDDDDMFGDDADGPPSIDQCFDPAEVRASLRWFVTLLDGPDTPEEVAEFCPGRSATSRRRFAQGLQADARSWIDLCAYAIKNKALVYKAYV